MIAAFVRAHVTLRLIEQLPPAPEPTLAQTRCTIHLRTPGGPRCSLAMSRDGVRFSPTLRGWPTLTLFFPRPADLVGVLSGTGGRVIPLPGGPGFLHAGRTFRALTTRLTEAFADPKLKPTFLLYATLFALEEVANRDPAVAARVARIPRGVIRVTMAATRGWVVRDRDGVRTGVGESPADARYALADLEFADENAAVELLSGTCSAATALAERRVRLYGFLPMIQNLFPILDRVGFYLRGAA